MEVVKQILANFPKGFITGLLLNGTATVLTYLIIWRLLKNKIRAWRIQIKERVNAKQIKRELKNSFFTLLVAATLSSVVFYLSAKGYTSIYTDISEHNILFAISGFFVLLLLDDTWFYWCHRLLHHPKLFKYVHAEHHKSVDVNPFTSMSFHFVEPLLLSLWILPASFIFPIYAPLLGIVQIWGLLDNLKAHLGYELYPSWWNKSIFKFLTSSTHHNMHHSKFHGNYGVHFRIWDKLLDTEFKDYETTFEEIQKRKKANVGSKNRTV